MVVEYLKGRLIRKFNPALGSCPGGCWASINHIESKITALKPVHSFAYCIQKALDGCVSLWCTRMYFVDPSIRC